MSQYETILFINVYEKDFIGHINKEPYEIKAGQERHFPAFVAEHLAKHLIDKILQEKFHVFDTLRETPLRNSLWAQILPEMKVKFPEKIKELDVKDEIAELKKELERERVLRQSLGEDVKSFKEHLSNLKEPKKPKVDKK